MTEFTEQNLFAILVTIVIAVVVIIVFAFLLT